MLFYSSFARNSENFVSSQDRQYIFLWLIKLIFETWPIFHWVNSLILLLNQYDSRIF